MEIKREVTVNGAGFVVAWSPVCVVGFTTLLADPVKVPLVLPSVRGWDISATPLLTQLDRADLWETASYLALWGSGLVGIGLCLI